MSKRFGYFFHCRSYYTHLRHPKLGDLQIWQSFTPTATQLLLCNNREGFYNSRRWLVTTGNNSHTTQHYQPDYPPDSQWVRASDGAKTTVVWQTRIFSHMSKSVWFPQERHQHYSSDFTVTPRVCGLNTWVFCPSCNLWISKLGCDLLQKIIGFCTVRESEWTRTIRENGKKTKNFKEQIKSLTKQNITSPHVCFQLACPPPPCLGLPPWHQEGGTVSAGTHVGVYVRSNGKEK